MSEVQCAVLHGAGRFAQHVLYAWLNHAPYLTLSHWCDEVLDAHAVCRLLRTHERLNFAAAQPAVERGAIALTRADGQRCLLPFFHGPATALPWRGEADLWLECSGSYPEAEQCRGFLTGRTKRVLVSATCWDADQTLVMGYNQEVWRADAQVLSYGSCTVNAFVPLAHWVYQHYGVTEAEVQVIHNVPAHRMTPHPYRKFCTLERMGPQLLPWLDTKSFAVNYTLIPYTGASLLEVRLRLQDVPARHQVMDALQAACETGALKNLYALDAEDSGVCAVLGSRLNAVFHKAGLRLQGDTLRLSGYFDNENSAARYWDLAQWLAEQCLVQGHVGIDEFAVGDSWGAPS